MGQVRFISTTRALGLRLGLGLGLGFSSGVLLERLGEATGLAYKPIRANDLPAFMKLQASLAYDTSGYIDYVHDDKAAMSTMYTTVVRRGSLVLH